MARNGASNAVTTKAAEPNQLYDGLSQDGQDLWDQIGSFGYVPEQGSATTLWFARKRGDKGGKPAVGPAESLQVLLQMVRDAADEDLKYEANNTVVDIRSNGNGRVKQPYLPGAEDIQELDDQADVCLRAQDEQQLAKSNFSEAKEEMKRRLKAHGRTNYKRGGWNMTIKNNEILELKQDKNRGVSDKPIEFDEDSEASQVVDPQD